MDKTYCARNDATRTRLGELVARLALPDLERPLGEGWTVKAALMHLAFWDRYATARLTQWQRTEITPSADVAELINLAALPDWLAAAPEFALREVFRAAAAADAVAASVDESLYAAVVAAGERWVGERHRHRTDHIDQIERILGQPPTNGR